MISVVIPLFNKASTIERCLNSVNNQIQIPDELIIINDGSQDHSLQIVNAWVKKNTKIYCRIINQPNKGVSYSRNKGVALSRNNFVAFLDADDVWHKDFICSVLKVIECYKDVSLVTCKHLINDSDLGSYVPEQIFGKSNIGLIEDYLLLAGKYPIVNSSKAVVNKKYFIESGGFPEEAKLCEDLFLWLKLSFLGPIGYCNDLLVEINQEPDESRGSRDGQVPYPIRYFSAQHQKSNLNKGLLNYLWTIHFKHVLGSLTKSKKEAFVRIKNGLKLFKLKGFFLFVLLLIPKYFFQKFRIYRRKKFIRKNGSEDQKF